MFIRLLKWLRILPKYRKEDFDDDDDVYIYWDMLEEEDFLLLYEQDKKYGCHATIIARDKNEKVLQIVAAPMSVMEDLFNSGDE